MYSIIKYKYCDNFYYYHIFCSINFLFYFILNFVGSSETKQLYNLVVVYVNKSLSIEFHNRYIYVHTSIVDPNAYVNIFVKVFPFWPNTYVHTYVPYVKMTTVVPQTSFRFFFFF